MQKIKFRCWDKNKKQMRAVRDICFDQYGTIDVYCECDDINEPAKGNDSLMQFTGLLDRNGKDIYEGDVVQEDIRRDKRSKPIMRWSVVVYSEKGMFIVECLPKSLRQWNELYKENDEVEVIGNIYENPELLNPLTR